MTGMARTESVDWKVVRISKNLLLITLRTTLALLATKGFMIPNRFVAGGIISISILFHEIFHINISFLVIALNVVFMYLGYQVIRINFTPQKYWGGSCDKGWWRNRRRRGDGSSFRVAPVQQKKLSICF